MPPQFPAIQTTSRRAKVKTEKFAARQARWVFWSAFSRSQFGRPAQRNSNRNCNSNTRTYVAIRKRDFERFQQVAAIFEWALVAVRNSEVRRVKWSFDGFAPHKNAQFA